MLEREVRRDVTLLRLCHGKANALDVPLLRALQDAFAREASSPSRAVVLTADGGIFCAGLDLFQLAGGGSSYIRKLLPALHDALRAAFTFPKPLVAALNGHTLAGGCVLAAAADARLAARGPFKIGVTEILVGFPFPPAALGLLRHVCAPAALQEVALTGRVWRPEEAVARGLVDEVVAPEALLPTAIARAEGFAAIPPAAWRLTKQQLRAETLARMDEDQKSLGAEILEAWCAPEVAEAVKAYVGKVLEKNVKGGGP
ncbi:MAG: enoyl-CoA hydratase/isomerase family protein [Planctomycetia bacterium]|nr:enoyl-CoA hydratase/isomerase family protein [Planctomycetia bacterium]